MDDSMDLDGPEFLLGLSQEIADIRAQSKFRMVSGLSLSLFSLRVMH